MGKLFKHKHHSIIYSGEKFKVTLIYNNRGYKIVPALKGILSCQKSTQETINSVRPRFRVHRFTKGPQKKGGESWGHLPQTNEEI